MNCIGSLKWNINYYVNTIYIYIFFYFCSIYSCCISQFSDNRGGTVDQTRRRVSRTRPSEINSASSDQVSYPSPDEIIIKGRGRRSLPIKWSPIPIESPKKTPLLSQVTKLPRKDGLILRSSPRKRLQLNDSFEDLVQSRRVSN